MNKRELYNALVRRGGDIAFLANTIWREDRKPKKNLKKLYRAIEDGRFLSVVEWTMDRVYVKGKEHPIHYSEL